MFLWNIVIILPYSPLTPWVYVNGFSITQLFDEDSQTSIGSFAWLDVVVSIIVLTGFILHGYRKEKIKYLRLPIIGALVVGFSLGLPLSHLLQRIHKEKQDGEEND